MIEFKAIDIKDRNWINACLRKADFKGCEYSFTNNFIWRKLYDTKVAKINGYYCTRGMQDGELFYNFPAGSYDKTEKEKEDIQSTVPESIQMKNLDLNKVQGFTDTINDIIDDARYLGHSFVLRGILEEQKEYLEVLFPNRFIFQTDRNETDYIYSVEKLSKLSGKKLHGKRNHISRFKESGEWNFEEITQQNLPECIEMNHKWCQLYHCDKDESLKHEICAVHEAFRFYKELELTGGLLRKNREVIAYSIGEPLSSDTFVIHIEKAFSEIQGAYPMINQQFVLNHCQEYYYVNREDDVGNEGLRKAKLSYYPDILLHKFTAKLQENNN